MSPRYSILVLSLFWSVLLVSVLLLVSVAIECSIAIGKHFQSHPVSCPKVFWRRSQSQCLVWPTAIHWNNNYFHLDCLHWTPTLHSWLLSTLPLPLPSLPPLPPTLSLNHYSPHCCSYSYGHCCSYSYDYLYSVHSHWFHYVHCCY